MLRNMWLFVDFLFSCLYCEEKHVLAWPVQVIFRYSSFLLKSRNVYFSGRGSYRLSVECDCDEYFSLYVGPAMSCQLLHFCIWRNLLKVSHFQNQEVRGESVRHTDTVNKGTQHQHVHKKPKVAFNKTSQFKMDWNIRSWYSANVQTSNQGLIS